MTHSSITDYHASLLDLPIEKGVIKTDIDGWLQPTEAHFLYKCAYESANILELGPYHGLSTTIIAQAKIDSGNIGTITTVDVFSKNIEKTKHNVEKIAPDVKISYNIDDAINFVVKQNELPMPVFYDMIFIDANHTYEWMKLLTQKVKPLSDGIMLFDDYYHRSTGVKQAVAEVLGEADKKIGSIGVYE